MEIPQGYGWKLLYATECTDRPPGSGMLYAPIVELPGLRDTCENREEQASCALDIPCLLDCLELLRAPSGPW